MSIGEDLLRELIRDIPEIAHQVLQWAGARGLDLGPIPPDMRKDFAQIEAEVLAAAAKRRGGP